MIVSLSNQLSRKANFATLGITRNSRALMSGQLTRPGLVSINLLSLRAADSDTQSARRHHQLSRGFPAPQRIPFEVNPLAKGVYFAPPFQQAGKKKISTCMSLPKQDQDQSTLTKTSAEKSDRKSKELIKRRSGTEKGSAMREIEDTSLGIGNRVLNVAAPVAVFLTVAVTSPALVLWRGFKWLVTSPVDMRNKVVVITGASSGIGMVSALASTSEKTLSAF